MLILTCVVDPTHRERGGYQRLITAPSVLCAGCFEENLHPEERLRKEAYLLLHLEWWTLAVAMGTFHGLSSCVSPRIGSSIHDPIRVNPNDTVPPSERRITCLDSLCGFAINIVGKLEILDCISDALAAAQAFQVSPEMALRCATKSPPHSRFHCAMQAHHSLFLT
eukprot:1267679-Amphidinium_carterae.1